MPQRYGQRTNPYYPDTGQDIPPQELGGMAYNPYSEKTDWGFFLRNALNNLRATREAQAEQAREDAERRKIEAKEAAKEAWGRAAEERRLQVLERPERVTPFVEKTEAMRKVHPEWAEGRILNYALDPNYQTPVQLMLQEEKGREKFKWEKETAAEIEARYGKPEDTTWKLGGRQIGLMKGSIADKEQKYRELEKKRIALDKSMSVMDRTMNFDFTTGEPTSPRGRAHVKLLSDVDNELERIAGQNKQLNILLSQLIEGSPLTEEQTNLFYSLVRGEEPKKSPELSLMDVLTSVGRSLFGGGQNVEQPR